MGTSDQSEEPDGFIAGLAKVKLGGERSFAADFVAQQPDTFCLGQASVVVGQAIACKDLAHGAAVAIGMLADVERSKMKAKDLGAVDQVGQSTLGDAFAFMGTEAIANQIEVVQKLGHIGIVARRSRVVTPGQLAMPDCGQQSAKDHDQLLPVRLQMEAVDHLFLGCRHQLAIARNTRL